MCICTGANIFLSSNGSIKLGDFGLSVQLQNLNNTKAKEVQKQAGTIRKSYTLLSGLAFLRIHFSCFHKKPHKAKFRRVMLNRR